jgi:predicted dienelactone hydrolase
LTEETFGGWFATFVGADGFTPEISSSMNGRSICFLLILLLPCWAAFAYDPLELPGDGEVRVEDRTFTDTSRNREVPVRIFLPDSDGPAPVILFSHGLGGSREGAGYLGKHWAARGYLVVAVQHPGSDTAVWKEAAPKDRIANLKEAASLQNFMLRAGDIPFVLDQLGKEPDLSGRADLRHVGMSGHSFGAVTTQAVSGEWFPVGGNRLTDPRIDAALAFSPSVRSRMTPEKSFGQVAIPWMLMTGTEDSAMIGDQEPESRLRVYPALPDGGKYELVLFDAEHSAFTERALPGDRHSRNPNHHRAILALSTAFWDAWLRNDASAREWLEGKGPGGILEAKDRWQWK